MELGQIGQATVSGGARTYYVHHQRGSEWGSATPLVDAFQAAAAAGKGAQVTHLPCIAARRLEDHWRCWSQSCANVQYLHSMTEL